MAFDIEWANTRAHYRREVFRVLNGLYEGRVDEDDLHRLNNFCAVALCLMSKSNLPTWRKAEKDAELAAWLKREVLDEEGNVVQVHAASRAVPD